MAKRESISASEKTHYQHLCQQTHPLIVLNIIALIVSISLFHLVFQPLPLTHPYALLFAALLPLLILIPGILKGSYRGAIWACFVTLLYFVAGVLNWTQEANWAYGMSETLLSFLLFNIALMYARWKGLSELPTVSH